MKRFRSSLVALAVLAALLGWLFYMDKPAREKKAEEEKKQAQVFSFSREDAAGITVRFPRSGTGVVLEKLRPEDEGADVWKWRILMPEATYADPARVDDLLRELEGLRSEKKVENPGGADFGFNPPALGVELRLKDGKTLGLELGSEARVEKAVYARRMGETAPVLLLDSYVRTVLFREWTELRDRAPARFESSRLTLFEITDKSGRLAFEKTGEKWAITEPRPLQADKNAVENLLQALEFMTASQVIAEKPAAAQLKEYGLTPPLMEAALTERRGARDRRIALRMGRKGDNLYVLRDWDGALLEVVSPRWNDLRGGLEYYRRSRLVELPKWEMEGVEVTHVFGETDRSFSLEKKDWEWKLTAPKAAVPDRVRMDDFLTALLNLRAAAYAEAPKPDKDYGLDAPFLSIKIAAKEGQALELRFGRAAGKIYARVSDWPGVLLEMREEALAPFTKGHEELLKPSPMPAMDGEHEH